MRPPPLSLNLPARTPSQLAPRPVHGWAEAGHAERHPHPRSSLGPQPRLSHTTRPAPPASSGLARPLPRARPPVRLFVLVLHSPLPLALILALLVLLALVSVLLDLTLIYYFKLLLSSFIFILLLCFLFLFFPPHLLLLLLLLLHLLTFLILLRAAPLPFPFSPLPSSCPSPTSLHHNPRHSVRPQHVLNLDTPALIRRVKRRLTPR